jgi:hypothetical protein
VVVLACFAFGSIAQARADALNPDHPREARLLAQIPQIARREGHALIITISGARHRIYEDHFRACAEEDPDNCEMDSLWSYDPQEHVVVVLRTYYESMDYLLLDLETGGSIVLENQPHKAPKGPYWAVVDESLASGDGQIQLVTDSEGFRVLGSIRRPYCMFERWDGDIAFLILCNSDNETPERGEFRITLGTSGTLTRSPTGRAVSEDEYRSIDAGAPDIPAVTGAQ